MKRQWKPGLLSQYLGGWSKKFATSSRPAWAKELDHSSQTLLKEAAGTSLLTNVLFNINGQVRNWALGTAFGNIHVLSTMESLGAKAHDLACYWSHGGFLFFPFHLPPFFLLLKLTVFLRLILNSWKFFCLRLEWPTFLELLKISILGLWLKNKQTIPGMFYYIKFKVIQ